MTSDLLATKLHRPLLPPGRIPRPQLLRRLREGPAAGRTLTLFSAPAGFGKTICAVEWLGAQDRPVAWLSLEDADDDPGRFFLYLIAALQGVDECIGRGIDGILRAGSLPSPEILHNTLSNDMMELDQPFLLALDDFQVIQDPVILQVVEGLALNPPPALHLVLLTREDPPLPLARLRANNRLTEIRAADLRFSPEEAGRFLKDSMGLALSAEDVEALERRTEGWIVGLHLAGLSIRDREDPSAFISELSGSHRHILGYLTDEVLSRQAPEAQEFLVATSILERLSGELCDAVTGGSGGRAALERLFRANLFLIPLDEEGRWYRYHQLFAGALRDRQKTLPPERTAGWHRRASRWFAGMGMAGEAVHHALQAGDYAAAVAQIESHAMDMLMQWHVKTVNGWVQSIPAEWCARSVQANLAFAWMHMIRGEPARAASYLQQLQVLFSGPHAEALKDPVLHVKWLAIQAMLLNAQGRAAEGAALCRKALEAAPEEDRQVRCIIHLGLAGACERMDDRAGAEESYRQIIRFGREQGNSVYELLGISALALSAIKHGQLHFAFELASEGMERIERSGSVPPVATAVYGELGTVCYQWHRLDEAHRYFQRAIQVGILTGFSDAQLFHGIILSRLHQIEGNLEAAGREIRKSAELMRAEGAVVVREEVIAQQARMCLALKKPADAEALLESEGFSFSGGFSAPDPPPGLASGALFTAALRILLFRAQSGGGEAGVKAGLALAERLIGMAAQREIVLLELELRILRSELHAAAGDAPASREDLLAALRLGEAEGYIAFFVEEGAAVRDALAGLLNEKTPAGCSAEYVRRILDAFSGGGEAGPAGKASRIAQLSEREREVLRLMAQGLRYDEVAQQLVISLNTVRSHVKTIYGKLGVDNRTRAIELAQRMNVL